MKSLIKNKKAATAYFINSFYRIMMIIIVCLVFVAVLWIQYSKPYDIRKIENAQIARKIELCLVGNNLVLAQEDFIEKKLNDCIKTDSDIFVNVTFGEKSISSGKQELRVYCQIQNQVTGRYLPSCLNYNYTILNSSHQIDQLNIFLALDKNKKNVQMMPNK